MIATLTKMIKRHAITMWPNTNNVRLKLTGKCLFVPQQIDARNIVKLNVKSENKTCEPPWNAATNLLMPMKRGRADM